MEQYYKRNLFFQKGGTRMIQFHLCVLGRFEPFSSWELQLSPHFQWVGLEFRLVLELSESFWEC